MSLLYEKSKFIPWLRLANAFHIFVLHKSFCKKITTFSLYKQIFYWTINLKFQKKEKKRKKKRKRESCKHDSCMLRMAGVWTLHGVKAINHTTKTTT